MATYTGIGDILVHVRADAINPGDHIWLEDPGVTVEIISTPRSGDLIRLGWRGGYRYLHANDTVVVEEMS